MKRIRPAQKARAAAHGRDNLGGRYTPPSPPGGTPPWTGPRTARDGRWPADTPESGYPLLPQRTSPHNPAASRPAEHVHRTASKPDVHGGSNLWPRNLEVHDRRRDQDRGAVPKMGPARDFARPAPGHLHRRAAPSPTGRGLPRGNCRHRLGLGSRLAPGSGCLGHNGLPHD
jgi:hypothetical protein